jgi:Domain of unknown function (DUF1972)
VHIRTVRSLPTKSLDTLTHGFTSGIAARCHRHDVLLVCNVANAPYLAVLRLLGQRSVLNTDGQEWLRGKWGRVGRAVFYACARLAPKAAPALVTDCVAMQAIYAEEFHARTTVIPYCWTTLPQKPPTKLPWRPEAHKYYIIGGRWNPLSP